MDIEQIHTSLVNGQKRQMVKEIDEYGLYDFWADYKLYLDDFYVNSSSGYSYFTSAVIAYHRIKNR